MKLEILGIICEICGDHCVSHAGFISHMKKHYLEVIEKNGNAADQLRSLQSNKGKVEWKKTRSL